jgi:uncharacterized protein (TIGR00255 family)
MESMTGYAFTEKSSDEFSYSVEIKSLNSKYLETYVNLPKMIRTEENEIQKMLKGYFSRGKIELNVDIYDWTSPRQVSLNHDLIKKYYRELKKIQASLGIATPVTLESILNLEGVSHKGRSGMTEKSLKDIYRSIEAVARKAIAMRKKEGLATKKDILASVAVISRAAGTIRDRVRDIARKKADELKARIESIALSRVEDTRVFTEIAILADKLDVNEELVRLNDHIEKFKAVIKESGQIGRKLDFLAQEMFREINTVASKSNSSEISHTVVEVKNHIDKIREQCRNIV